MELSTIRSDQIHCVTYCELVLDLDVAKSRLLVVQSRHSGTELDLWPLWQDLREIRHIDQIRFGRACEEECAALDATLDASTNARD